MENYNSMIEEYRPKMKIETTKLHKILDGMSMVIIVGVLAYVALNYSKLPNDVSIHFALDGTLSQGATGRSGAFMFILVGVIGFIATYIISMYPNRFFYKVELNEKNVERQYLLAKTYLKSMGLIVVMLFGTMQCLIINATLSGSNSVGVSYYIFLIPIVVTMYLYKLKSMNAE